MDNFIQAGTLLFFRDEDRSEFCSVLVTEHNMETYTIHIDRNCPDHKPFYQLFREWKEGRRVLHTELFATSKLPKLQAWIIANIPQ